jgi:hydrogenase nickel incorporation protein HypB
MCSTCGCSDHASIHVHQAHEDAEAPATLHVPIIYDHGNVGHSHPNSDPNCDAHDPGAAHGSQTARIVRLEQDILAKNGLIAARNRGWFEGRQIFALNLMSSPGAGKTTLLERTIHDLAGTPPVVVIEGDQATARDAVRIMQAGAKAVQINTGSGCHLDAAMLSAAVGKLDPPRGSLLVIENVGNLVCPALFDLGVSARIVIVSVTEGEDKPLKYPNMFRFADIMILNKTDLLPYLKFDIGECMRYAHQVNPKLGIFRLSAVTGDGLDAWCVWLRQQMERLPGAADFVEARDLQKTV